METLRGTRGGERIRGGEGGKRRRRRRRRRRRKTTTTTRRPVGSLLGPSLGFLGAHWGPHGGLFGASLGLLGAVSRPSWGYLRLSSRPPGPCWRPCWPAWAVLEAILGILDALESARDVFGRRRSLGKRGRCMRLGATRGGVALRHITGTLPDRSQAF